MRNYIHLFLIICCLACDGSTPVEPPAEKITPEMMEDIFYDLMLMKAIKNSSYANRINSLDGIHFISYVPYGFESKLLDIDN